MRKRITKPLPNSVKPEQWLDIEHLAQVEVTSEDPEAPVENALVPSGNSGWQAAEAGRQTLRILFDQPQRLRRIRLWFIEEYFERTQEFVLRWSPDLGQSFHEIVRQRWNFSPQGATREEEEFRVDLAGVTILELTVTPDVSGALVRATLAGLCVA